MNNPAKPSTVLALLMAFCLMACIDRDEGCLDPGASNYDLHADKACTDCCTFPVMQLIWSPKWDADNFSVQDTFYDQHQAPYFIRDIQFFLSSWSWTNEQSAVFTVDTVEGNCEAQPLRYTPDIIRIQPDVFNYTLGTIRDFPEIREINFNLGLTRDYSCLDPEDTDTPEALDRNGPLWDPVNVAYVTARLILQRDITVDQRDTILMEGLFSHTVVDTIDLSPGSNGQIRLTCNYADWFRTANVENVQSFTNAWQNGVPGSIFPTP